ncbi:MAG: SDR family NAD(P)-dependent oxidoreductase [Chloroflexota bacterium]
MQGLCERIVVTGGAGFIGSHLVERLLKEGAGSIVLLDDFSRGQFTNLRAALGEPRFTIVQADVRDRDAVHEALAGASLVFHLAGRMAQSDDPRELEDVLTTNVVGTFNVLRAASDNLARRVIFASSYEAYGVPLSLPVDEEHPLHAVELNGASKVSAEAYCRAFRRVFGLQTVILRLAEVYGPRDVYGLIPQWLEQAEQGHDLVVQDKDRVTDLIWVDDVVDAMMRAAQSDAVLPPINVASGTGTRLVDVARRVARLSRHQPRVRALTSSSSDARRFVANVERMRRILQMEPSLDPLERLEGLLPNAQLVSVT